MVVLAAGLLLGGSPALAQDDTAAIDLTNAPVDMHEGTCADPVLDPWDEIGRLNRRLLGEAYDPYAPDTAYGVYGDDEFLSEDLDEDGILDDGEDLDGDGVLDFGIDANDDGVLNGEEVIAEGEAVIAIVNLPTVYEASGEIDAGFEPIFNQPNVITVHESSENYETIVACGNVGGLVYEDEEEIVVGLSAVGGSNVRGYAVFQNDGSLFGTDPTGVAVYVIEGLPTHTERLMEGTPEAGTPAP
jgi:hypothetical protein